MVLADQEQIKFSTERCKIDLQSPKCNSFFNNEKLENQLKVPKESHSRFLTITFYLVKREIIQG